MPLVRVSLLQAVVWMKQCRYLQANHFKFLKPVAQLRTECSSDANLHFDQPLQTYPLDSPA